MLDSEERHARERPVDVYRQMLFGSFRSTHQGDASIDDITQQLNAEWRQIPSSPTEDAAALRIHVACCLLAYGDFSHLEEMLETMRSFPDAWGHRVSRYFVSAINRLLPLPGNPDVFAIVRDPERVSVWLASVQNQLVWNECEGRFELKATA